VKELVSPEPSQSTVEETLVDQNATTALYVTELHWVALFDTADDSGQAMKISCVGQVKSTSSTISKKLLSPNIK
jgi:hypothetical protein